MSEHQAEIALRELILDHGFGHDALPREWVKRHEAMLCRIVLSDAQVWPIVVKTLAGR